MDAARGCTSKISAIPQGIVQRNRAHFEGLSPTGVRSAPLLQEACLSPRSARLPVGSAPGAQAARHSPQQSPASVVLEQRRRLQQQQQQQQLDPSPHRSSKPAQTQMSPRHMQAVASPVAATYSPQLPPPPLPGSAASPAQASIRDAARMRLLAMGLSSPSGAAPRPPAAPPSPRPGASATSSPLAGSPLPAWFTRPPPSPSSASAAAAPSAPHRPPRRERL